MAAVGNGVREVVEAALARATTGYDEHGQDM
jgi:hypothetical protein